MDETRLVRELLERAMVPEPPLGPMVQNALRAGIRLRRRRRVQAIASGTAAAVVCAAALAVPAAIHNRAAPQASGTATVYVIGGSSTQGAVTPISAATNQPGRPIVLGSGFMVGLLPEMAVTPNEKTIYATDGLSAVAPISTATNRAGKPVEVVHEPDEGIEQIVAAPDGKTIYVLDSTTAVTPISTGTNRPGKRADLGAYGFYSQMTITPDGKTLYVAILDSPAPSYVIPIATATSRPGKRITVRTTYGAIVAAPDGKTVYLIGDSGPDIAVTPIATATNTPGKPIPVGKGSIGIDTPVVMTRDGKTMYISNGKNGVIPFATAINRPGKIINVGAASVINGIALSPDGHTLYALSQPPGQEKLLPSTGSGSSVITCTSPPGYITPIATATNAAGEPIKVGCLPRQIAFTPDGKAAYVVSGSGVTPIVTATGRTGKLIRVWQAASIVIVHRSP